MEIVQSQASELHRARAWQIYAKSIPQLFLERVTQRPKDVAYRYKNFGIYQEVTWQRFYEEVQSFALGLVTLGVESGDRVAIMGDPCHEYFVADMAALSIGAITYGIYTSCSVPEVRYQLVNGGAKVFVAENQEYVDKVLEIAEPLPSLKSIIVGDMRAMFIYNDPRISSFGEVQERGRTSAGAGGSKRFEQQIAKIKPDEIAVFIYTSGTTGPPKAATITHRDLMVGMVHPYLEGFPELDRDENHRIITHLPLAHLVERSMSLCLMLIANVVPHIGEEIDNLRETLCEVEPTFFHAVPRVWEKMASQICVNIERSTRLKRLVYWAAMRVGERHVARRRSGRVPLQLEAAYRLARLCVFKPMLMKLGMPRVKAALTAGAPIPPHVQEMWHVWGVNLRNLYGITEHTLVLCQVGEFPPPGDAGLPLFPKEVRLAEDGEILVRGPGIFAGYFGNEQATREAIRDGWLHTGDVAIINHNGHFKIVDRKKDIMITAGGKNITPSEIENLMKSSSYISELVLIADGRPYPTALVEIDYDTVSDWARQSGVIYTSYTSLATHQKVISLIANEIDKYNCQLARVEQVKKFRIIPKELGPEEGDTTPTRKIKRKHTYEMFRDLVESMYSGASDLASEETSSESAFVPPDSGGQSQSGNKNMIHSGV